MALEHGMILSASGWRKVFAESGDEQDFTREIGKTNYALAIMAASSFARYVTNLHPSRRITLVVGSDTRPTGAKIVEAVLKALVRMRVAVKFVGVSAAPEIMAYARASDGFIYVTASHNPVGHNGLKFGRAQGGVLSVSENKKVMAIFKRRLASCKDIEGVLSRHEKIDISVVMSERDQYKRKALGAYEEFCGSVISSINAATREGKITQEQFFEKFNLILRKRKIGVVCDFNGSARAAGIDKEYFQKHGVSFYPMNDVAGSIAHEIIPERENLNYAKRFLERVRAKHGCRDAILGYMCDCDGDRGNIVYWSEKAGEPKILEAQEVFALSVMSELAFSIWLHGENKKAAVAVNGPTSMRIDEIARILGAEVFRAEVGEANVVNLAKILRIEGRTVRILGEGSNGGNITHPSSVRDPLSTVFAILKLLAIRDTKTDDGSIARGLFHIWCDKNRIPYKKDFTLDDIIATLPHYTTTGVSEARAVMKISSTDFAKFKDRFQAIFENEFAHDKSGLCKKYGITSWRPVATNGTKERFDIKRFSISRNGGLKILFYEKNSREPSSFIWMRSSGTEPVFRVMCDVKGANKKKERELLEWERRMIFAADKKK